MRPVERGPRPLNPDGSFKIYRAYGDSRRDLIERMGQYCSYCNQRLPASLAVEHVQPKSLTPTLELEWGNFLLGCTNCNSIKNDTPINLVDYLWPDMHNTHLAFVYSEDGSVEVNSNLSDSLLIKAQNLLDLVGLQKYPNNPTASDRRWTNRKEAFTQAKLALNLYNQAAQKGVALEFAIALGQWAANNGFFSVWIQVFDAFPNVKHQIITAFVGTAVNAFDRSANPISRTGEL